MRVCIVTHIGHEEDDFRREVAAVFASEITARNWIKEQCEDYVSPEGYARDHYEFEDYELVDHLSEESCDDSEKQEMVARGLDVANSLHTQVENAIEEGFCLLTRQEADALITYVALMESALEPDWIRYV